jgi:ribose transport system ATP-binding protein
VKDTSTREVITLMTGRTIEYVFPPRPEQVDPDAAPLLEVTDLALAGEFAGVSFTVRPGEVLGLAGLVGSGRSEILETVYGARKATGGTVQVGGRRLRHGDVAAAVSAGIGLAPEERKSQGLLLGEPIYRNITLSTLTRFARGGFLSGGAEKQAARDQAEALDLRPVDVEREVRTLSGGNQQKVVLARWLLRDCRVLLLDEPTRGVDVGARLDLYQSMRKLASEGVGILISTADHEEVVQVADRALCMARGRVVVDLEGDAITTSELLTKTAG